MDRIIQNDSSPMDPDQLFMDPGQLFNQLMHGAPQPVDNSFILPSHYQHVGHFDVGNDLVLEGWPYGNYSLVDNISGADLSSRGPMLHPVSEFDHAPGTDPSSLGVDGGYSVSGYATLDLTPGVSGAQTFFNNVAVPTGTDVWAPAVQPFPTFNQGPPTWPVAPISLGHTSSDFIQADAADIGSATAMLEDGFRTWPPPLGLDLNTAPLRKHIPGICQPQFEMYQEHDGAIPGPAETNTAPPLIPIVDLTLAPTSHYRPRRKGGSSPKSWAAMRSVSKLTARDI